MLTLFIKYSGNKKFGLHGFFKDWTPVGRFKTEMAAVEVVQKFQPLFKNFEFKFE